MQQHVTLCLNFAADIHSCAASTRRQACCLYRCMLQSGRLQPANSASTTSASTGYCADSGSRCGPGTVLSLGVGSHLFEKSVPNSHRLQCCQPVSEAVRAVEWDTCNHCLASDARTDTAFCRSAREPAYRLLQAVSCRITSVAAVYHSLQTKAAS